MGPVKDSMTVGEMIEYCTVKPKPGREIVVDIEKLEAVRQYLLEVNCAKFEDIVWTRGLDVITPTAEQVYNFHEYGFSNKDFPRFLTGEDNGG